MTQPTIPKQKLIEHLFAKKRIERCLTTYTSGWNDCIDSIALDISLGKLDDVKPWLDAIAKDKVTPI